MFVATGELSGVSRSDCAEIPAQNYFQSHRREAGSFASRAQDSRVCGWKWPRDLCARHYGPFERSAVQLGPLDAVECPNSHSAKTQFHFFAGREKSHAMKNETLDSDG